MGEDRIVKELDRLHDLFASMDGKIDRVDGKIDKLRDEVYTLGKTQATYAERVDNVVNRVNTIESDQKAARRLAVTTLVAVLASLIPAILNLLK